VDSRTEAKPCDCAVGVAQELAHQVFPGCVQHADAIADDRGRPPAVSRVRFGWVRGALALGACARDSRVSLRDEPRGADSFDVGGDLMLRADLVFRLVGIDTAPQLDTMT